MAEQQPTDQPQQRHFTKSPLFWIAAFFAVIVLVDIANMGISVLMPALRGPETRSGVGQTLTFLELAPLTGSPPLLSASDLQGRVTLLNFWGTWCPPCRVELPHMAELHKRFAGQAAFRLVAISYPPGGGGGDLKSLHEETASLLKELNLDLPTYCDPDSKTLAAVDGLIGFQAFPTTLLLDRQGTIRAIWVGYGPGVEKQMAESIEKALRDVDETR